MKLTKRYARRRNRKLHFEALEERRVLAVTLVPGSGVEMAPLVDMDGMPDYVNVSEDSSNYQSEMTLDVNPTDPLHLAGFSHKRDFEAEVATFELSG